MNSIGGGRNLALDVHGALYSLCNFEDNFFPFFNVGCRIVALVNHVDLYNFENSLFLIVVLFPTLGCGDWFLDLFCVDFFARSICGGFFFLGLEGESLCCVADAFDDFWGL